MCQPDSSIRTVRCHSTECIANMRRSFSVSSTSTARNRRKICAKRCKWFQACLSLAKKHLKLQKVNSKHTTTCYDN